MANEVYDSTIRIMHDPDGDAAVLLAIGDPLWSLVRLDGQQIVDMATGPRWAWSKAFARGNDSHELVFEIVRENGGPIDALRKRLRNIATLPKDSADMLISFDVGMETEEHFRLKDAAVRQWPGFEEDHLSIERITIVGGAIILDEDGPYEEGSKWGEPEEEP